MHILSMQIKIQRKHNDFMNKTREGKQYLKLRICTKSAGDTSLQIQDQIIHKLLPLKKSCIEQEFQDYKQEQDKQVMILFNIQSNLFSLMRPIFIHKIHSQKDKTKSQIPRNKFAKNGRNPKIMEIVKISIQWLEDPRLAPKAL